MEFIWDGDFDEDHQKEGLGKEYDFDDNVIFEGKYSEDLRIEGVEYYIIGKKKYVGKYKDGMEYYMIEIIVIAMK